MKNLIIRLPNETKVIDYMGQSLGKIEEMQFLDEKDGIEVSDGFHTMSELYEHRYALFAALVKVYDGYKTPLGCNVTCYKSKFHFNGTMFKDCFIVMMIISPILVSQPKQISYHFPISWWDKFQIMELERMWEWDGHTSDDVLKRLMEL